MKYGKKEKQNENGKKNEKWKENEKNGKKNNGNKKRKMLHDGLFYVDLFNFVIYLYIHFFIRDEGNEIKMNAKKWITWSISNKN